MQKQKARSGQSDEAKKQAQYEQFVKNSMYSEEERKEAMNSARKNDRYDINFLETVQNDSFSGGKHYNRQKMLSEYSKYLKNPAEYMTTHESDNGLEYDDESDSNTVYGSRQKSQKDYDNAYEKAEDAYKKVMWKGSTEKEIKKASDNLDKARKAMEDNYVKTHPKEYQELLNKIAAEKSQKTQPKIVKNLYSNKMTESKKKQAAELYNNRGYDAKDIAEKLNIPYSDVTGYLVEIGVLD